MAAVLGLATWCVVACLGRRGLAIATGLAVWFGYAPALNLLGGRTPTVVGAGAGLLIVGSLLFAVRRELRWVLVTLSRRPQLAGGILGGLLIIRVTAGYALDHLGGSSPRGALGLGAGVAAALMAGAWLMSAPARVDWVSRAARLPVGVFDRGLNAINGGALTRLLGTGIALGATCLVLDRPAVASALGVPAVWYATTVMSALLAALMLRAAAQSEKSDLGRRMRALVARQRRELDAQLARGAARPIRQRYAWYAEEV